MAKSERLELGDIFTDIIGIYSTTVTYLARQTDGQTDRQTEFSSLDRVYSMQRGDNNLPLIWLRQTAQTYDIA